MIAIESVKLPNNRYGHQVVAVDRTHRRVLYVTAGPRREARWWITCAQQQNLRLTAEASHTQEAK